MMVMYLQVIKQGWEIPEVNGIFQQVAEGIHSAKDLEKIQGRKIVFRPFY
jgi:hypothetical protein